MAGTYRAPGFSSGEILIPQSGYPMEKWAVIACDQFTSQPDYWENARKLAEDAPSALNLILPEVYLSQTDERLPAIRSAMKALLDRGVLRPGVEDGFVLVERQTTQGTRLGLIGLIDLEEYDYRPGAKGLVRPTEGTIPERVPPRARIRSGADLELPHVMMLVDDPKGLLIESLYQKRESMRKLYDFELMLGGGTIAGYAVEGESAAQAAEALRSLHADADGLLYAVGDGNHSLAAAKACWEEIKSRLTEEEARNHPARYAMAELVNIHCPALVFEPIHRILKNADPEEVRKAWEACLTEKGICWETGDDVRLVFGESEVGYGMDVYPLPVLQEFCQNYGAELDYIHGETDLRALAKENATGFLLRVIDKSELFSCVRREGVLPRKAFSMGEARDKRYYLEARKLTI